MTQGGQPRGLRLALVSAYPPSIGPLSEYAWHLVESLRRSERVAELHVLADRAPGAVPFDDGHLRVCVRRGRSTVSTCLLKRCGPFGR